jgi:antitoxin component YwqK of YwqJK toxin-antitoxin module
MNNFIVRFIPVIFFTITLLVSCSEEKPKSSLIIKDNLLYKIGEDKPFTGTERGTVDGKILEYEVVDGLKQGKFRIYYADETIAVDGQIDSNKNVGKWQYFYPSGSLESEGGFTNDQPEGKWLWFYESGIVKEEGNFKAGMKIGSWKQFNELGELISEEEFLDEDSSYNNQIQLNL